MSKYKFKTKSKDVTIDGYTFTVKELTAKAGLEMAESAMVDGKEDKKKSVELLILNSVYDGDELAFTEEDFNDLPASVLEVLVKEITALNNPPKN